MPKYVLGYHGGAGMPEDEAGQAALMERWNGWFGQLGESVVDSGNPFSQARTVAAGGAVTEGGGTNPLTAASSAPQTSTRRSPSLRAVRSSRAAAASRWLKPSTCNAGRDRDRRGHPSWVAAVHYPPTGSNFRTNPLAVSAT